MKDSSKELEVTKTEDKRIKSDLSGRQIPGTQLSQTHRKRSRSPEREKETETQQSESLQNVGIFKKNNVQEISSILHETSKAATITKQSYLIKRIIHGEKPFSLRMRLTKKTMQNKPGLIDAILDHFNTIREEDQRLKPLDITTERNLANNEIILFSDNIKDIKIFLSYLGKKEYAAEADISNGLSFLNSQKESSSSSNKMEY
jgi:hypothetical protein